MSRLATFLILFVVLLLILLSRSCNRIDEVEFDRQAYEDLINLKNQQIEVWKDKEGKSRARAKVAIATAEAAKAVYPELLEENKNLKKDLSNLETALLVATNTSGSFTTVLTDTVYQTKTDTVFAKTFTYSDKWSKFHGKVLPNDITIDYEVRDSLTFTSYYKGQNFFRKGELVIEGVSHNPKTSITGLQNIKIVKPRKRNISIGPTFNYGINGTGGFTWNIGIGVQWKWIEL